MRFLGLLLLVLLFVGPPVVILETAIMPELEELKHTYSNLDEITQKIAEN